MDIYITPTRQDISDCTNQIKINVVNDATVMDLLSNLDTDLEEIIQCIKWIEGNPIDMNWRVEENISLEPTIDIEESQVI